MQDDVGMRRGEHSISVGGDFDAEVFTRFKAASEVAARKSRSDVDATDEFEVRPREGKFADRGPNRSESIECDANAAHVSPAFHTITDVTIR